jgi:soluble cytochrome b562
MVRRPQLLDLATRQKPVIQESISQSEQYTKNYQEGFSKLIIYALAGG